MNEPESSSVPIPEPVVPSGGEPAAAPTSSGGAADSGAAAPGAAGTGEAEQGDPQQGDSQQGGERRRRRRRRRGRGRGEAGAPGEPGAPGEAGEPGAESASATGAPLQGPQQPHHQRPRHEHGRHERGRQELVRHEHGRHGQGHGRFEPGRHGRPRGDSAHYAMMAVRSLADMAHALLRIEGVDVLSMPRYLDLNLRVPLDGGNDVRHAAGTAVEQILQRVREVREHEKALRPGAVFSYFAGSSHAEGCRPTEPRQVFDGYSSTGKPVFADFVTMSIERKDPDIDRLLAGEDIVLTRVTMGRVLRTQQLAEFGGNSPVFKILGQVDAGLFKVLSSAGKCAFSFQLLRGATLEGRVRLRLHPVGAVDPMELADAAVVQILSRFQRRLDAEALRLQGQSQLGDVDEESFVLPLLNDLARQLQGRARSAGRRTQHGLERSEEGQRPTSRAYPDAGEANDASILWDLDQNTIVVLGAKGRVHVFTPAGKHVTSVMMHGAAIDRRRHMGRWRLAEPEERGEFRIQVKRLIAAGQDAPREDPADVVVPAAGSPAGSPPAQG